MTGPEHYAEAERLLELMPGSDGHSQRVYASAAQAHATLALAAATAEARMSSFGTHAADKRWADVLGEPPPVTGRPTRRREGT